MKKLWQLKGKERRCSLRVLRRLQKRQENGFGSSFLRGSTSFRLANRLHRAGLITAIITKWAFVSSPKGYPFREIEIGLAKPGERIEPLRGYIWKGLV